MKTNTRHLLVASGIILITGGALLALKHPSGSAPSPSLAPASSAKLHSTSVEPVPASPSTPSSPRRDRSGPAGSSLAQKGEPKMPEGMDPEAWKQASALINLVSMMGSMGNLGGLAGANAETTEIDDVAKKLGLTDGARDAIDKQLAARDDKRKEAIDNMMKTVKDNSQELTEFFTLSIMEQSNPLTPAQSARQDQLKQLQESLNPSEDMKQQPWDQDPALLASMRDQMTPDQQTGLDDYLQDKKRKAADRKAFSDTQSLASSVDLDSDQTKAVLDLYRENPDAGDDQILPLLNDSQKAAYQAEKDKQKALADKIASGGAGLFGHGKK